MRLLNVSVLPLWTRRNLPHLRAGSHRINRRHHKISEFRRAIWLILVLLIRLLRRRRLSGIIVAGMLPRSEEHTSELQSRFDLVCRLLLEKKKHKILVKYIAYSMI